MDRRRMPVDALQRLGAIGGSQHRIPPRLQHPLGQHADLFLVLHNKYRLRSTGRGGRAPGRLRRLRQLGHSREIDLEGGAVAQLAVRPDVPAALLDDAVRSEEHTSELQSQSNLVCRLLLEKKKKTHSMLS